MTAGAAGDTGGFLGDLDRVAAALRYAGAHGYCAGLPAEHRPLADGVARAVPPFKTLPLCPDA